MTMRLRVNPIACDRHGLCAELLPELIRLDDWGYPIVERFPVPVDVLHQECQELGDLRQRRYSVGEVTARSHQLEQPVAGDVAQVVDVELSLEQPSHQPDVHRRALEHGLAKSATAR